MCQVPKQDIESFVLLGPVPDKRYTGEENCEVLFQLVLKA